MGEVFKIASAIIASIGGSGVILLGLSSWLGKVWANRMLEDEKKNHTLEIEDFKSKLNKEINLVNSIIDKSVYITKLQYDKEFSIYLEIWERLAKCVISSKKLYPNYEQRPLDEDDLEKFNEKKWDKFIEDYNDFSNIILKYSPFYEENLYLKFLELRDLCSEQGNLFGTYTFDVKYSATYTFARNATMSVEEHRQVYTEFPKSIDSLQNVLQKEIRAHLKSLQAIDS